MNNNFLNSLSQRIKNITSDYLVNNGWYNKADYNSIAHPLLKGKLINNFFCHKKTIGFPGGIPSHRYILFYENNKYKLVDFAKDTIIVIKSQYHLNKLLKLI